MTSDWPTKPLSEITESITYGHTASAQDNGDGPKFLRITDIQNDKVDWNTVPLCECSPREEAASLLRRGDILFARTGATTGKSFLIRDCPKRAIFASYLIRVRPSPTVDSVFLSHFFKTDAYWRQITQKVRGVAQPGVNATTLGTLQIPLPPMAEQQRIAAILDRAEALRAMRRQALAKFESLTASLFLEMFGDPVVNPSNWTRAKLKNVVLEPYGVKAGPFGSSLKKEEYTESGYRIYGQEQVLAGRFDVGDYYIGPAKYRQLASCAVQKNDVLMSLVGSFGAVLVVPDGIEPGIINPRLLRIRPNREKLNSYFLADLLRLPSVQKELQRHSHGGTMGILNAAQIKDLNIILPPVAKQSEYINRSRAIQVGLERQRAADNELQSLFSSLQSRCFRGEL